MRLRRDMIMTTTTAMSAHVAVTTMTIITTMMTTMSIITTTMSTSITTITTSTSITTTTMTTIIIMITTMAMSVHVAAMTMITTIIMQMRSSQAGAVRLLKNIHVRDLRRSLRHFPSLINMVSSSAQRGCFRQKTEHGSILIWFRKKLRSVRVHRNIQAVCA